VTGETTILGLAGSLRRASYNRGLLRAAAEAAPANVRLEAADLAPIPLYNADVEADGDPAPVAALKDAVARSDALLVATPENNYSIPGVLKNAIDWVSRPPRSVLRHKPIALMGATPGGFGTVRAQLALRQVFVFTDSYVLPKPELWVSRARERFDEDGNLTDDALRDDLRALIDALVDFAGRLRPGGAPSS
jgi:chromate reductase, NAD(P)H dehydrogenase (quinone)